MIKFDRRFSLPPFPDILFNLIPFCNGIYIDSRKRNTQDCGSTKHNSVAKLARLVAANSPLANLLFYVKWYNEGRRRRAIPLIPRIFQLPNHSYLYLCLPLYPFSFVHPVATNRIIYRYKSIHIYIYVSTVKMYSWLLETIRRFVFYSNNMPLMNTSYSWKKWDSREQYGFQFEQKGSR